MNYCVSCLFHDWIWPSRCFHLPFAVIKNCDDRAQWVLTFFRLELERNRRQKSNFRGWFFFHRTNSTSFAFFVGSVKFSVSFWLPFYFSVTWVSSLFFYTSFSVFQHFPMKIPRNYLLLFRHMRKKYEVLSNEEWWGSVLLLSKYILNNNFRNKKILVQIKSTLKHGIQSHRTIISSYS